MLVHLALTLTVLFQFVCFFFVNTDIFVCEGISLSKIYISYASTLATYSYL